MNYYKIIHGNLIIGAVTTDDMRRQSANKKLILFANEERAQFVDYLGTYYYDDWLRPLPEGSTLVRTLIDLVRIEQTEYDEIKAQLDEGDFPQDDSLDEIIETDDNNASEEEPVVQKTAAQILEEQIKMAAIFAEV